MTVPVRTNCPVSTVRVLMVPARGARTSDRRAFWRAISRRRRRGGLRAETLQLGARPLQLFRRHQVLLRQGLAALEVGAGAVGFGLRASHVGLRALELHAVALGVDARQHRSRAHPGALVEEHRAHRAFHLGRHLDQLLGLQRAQGLDVVRHVLGAHAGHADGHRPAGASRGGRARAAAAGQRQERHEESPEAERGNSERGQEHLTW
jgi:hypothetical protein